MTQEEKAKAYDKALAIAKKNYYTAQDLCSGTQIGVECFKNTLANIFPELKESEDERIRKALLEMVHDTTGDELWVDYNVHKEAALAWLEKQGEQKQEINNFDVLPGLYKCVHRMFDGTPDGRLLFEVGNVYRCLSKHDRAEFEVSYGHSIYLEDPVVCKHFIPYEQQGEQKSQRMISAEAKEAMYGKPAWTKEDDVRLQACIDALQAESLMGKVDTVMTKWLESLKQRIGGYL